MQKKIIKLFTFIVIGFIFSVMIQNNSYAQKVNKKDFQTELLTNSPVYSIVLEVKDDSGEDLGMLEIQVIDRQNQFESVKNERLISQAKGLDPIRPKVKVILVPEISLRTYKVAESMEELRQPVDGTNVLILDYMVLNEAKRITFY